MCYLLSLSAGRRFIREHSWKVYCKDGIFFFFATAPGFDPCRVLPLSSLDTMPAQHWFGMLKREHRPSFKLLDFEICVVFPVAEN